MKPNPYMASGSSNSSAWEREQHAVDVPCPTCLAVKGKRCANAKGFLKNPHKERKAALKLSWRASLVEVGLPE